MIAGFQSLHDDYTVQLTDEQVYFRFITKGVVSNSTSDWTTENGGSTVSNYWTIDLFVPGLAVNHAPMLAIHAPASGVWAYMSSSLNGGITWRLTSSNPTLPIEYFVFANTPPPTNPSRCGLELFADDGVTLLYASDTKIARPLGMYDGIYHGDNLAGKKLAFVPIKQYRYEVVATLLGDEGYGICDISQYGYQMIDWSSVQETGITTPMGSINSWQFYKNHTAFGVCATTTFPPPETEHWRESGAEQALILDVTGY